MHASKCRYCTSRGDVEGTLELLSHNRVVIFTPDSSEIASEFQCIVHAPDILESEMIKQKQDQGSFLRLRMMPILEDKSDKETKSVLFRFEDQIQLMNVCREIVCMRTRPAAQSKKKSQVSLIPFYSDHIKVEIRTDPSLLPTIGVDDKPANEFRGSFLLTETFADQIRDLLPLQYRFAELRLLFSPKIHGISIPAFYRRADSLPAAPSIMILTDSHKGCVLGAFCKSQWTNSRSQRFYGSAENFIFTLKKDSTNNVQVFLPNTSANPLFQFSDLQRIVVGGGAISVFDNWLRGSSNPCSTFGTESSLACSAEFVVGDIEFWALISHSKQSGVPITDIHPPSF